MTTRRGFIKAGGLALFGIGSGGIPPFLAKAAADIRSPKIFQRKKVLICIFQRGAMDGLMAVTPFTDPYLQAARPTLFMSAAKTSNNPLIDLDGRFGLHPALGSFEPMFRDNRLAIVHGIGSPNTTRSHFDAQDYMESGTPFKKGTPSGWLNRAAGLLGHEAATPFQAVSLTSSLPRSLYGDSLAVAINNLRDFNIQLRGNQAGANMAAKSFESLYDETSLDLLQQTGKESFEAVKMLQTTASKSYKPANNAVYPASSLGNSLKQIAQLIKMDVGLEVAFAESGGWDTHFNQGTQTGIFARNLSDLSGSMMALWTDLEAMQDNVIIMTMTEFGRTVHQNGTGGTDHGRASCNFILGNHVKGGLVHGKVAPLAIENLEDGRDLMVTTDFRSVFSEVANKHLGISDNKILFPEWTGEFINVMRS
ncbi:DUF1501 domain-containing protein [Dyadobacter chenwenxiniae]|uniref:DUF1501 domain-containing protein n=1 Tax=Dyadobacter chenwenxiniae TaxID=2906456 RepID=A0A9X1PNT0_9BACT|nr:DUF1501 domain-containing protein [Dyadobacter chenwenxiniae]MCF0063785.1 DUF1501 domain-containing protein [Dyadobacter chenwenxiniae]UON83461.1 DUF1501 domain-containing protein [Dyadobacter chenwenxiniae]